MKKLIALLAAGALLLLAASPAQAVTKTDYEVIVEGQASYGHSQLLPVIEGEWTRQEEASFKWRTRFPLVSFVGKGLGAVSASPTTTVTAPNATSHESIPKPDGAMTGDCSGDLLAAPANGAWLGGASAPDLDPNTEDVGIRLLGDVSIVLSPARGSSAKLTGSTFTAPNKHWERARSTPTSASPTRRSTWTGSSSCSRAKRAARGVPATKRSPPSPACSPGKPR